jgi:FecR protein
MTRDERPPQGPIEPGELPLASAPEGTWESILASVNAEPRRSVFRWWQWAAAFSLVAAVLVTWYATRPKPAGWEVVRIDGTPVIGSKHVAANGTIGVGQWLRTDGSSRARIAVGAIGTVEVEPNSQIRLLAAKPNEHRLELKRGEISAVVSAPPRLFFVDTPASTAVDLGCAYTMKTDESGSGLLHVTTGWVSLEWKGRESLVPAGASCRTKSGTGPGTPYFSDASEGLQNALASFDFGNGGAAAAEMVVTEARFRDTLTLWHLLSRVGPEERVRIFDRMIGLAPLPEDISREKILNLDKETLQRWVQEMAWKW